MTIRMIRRRAGGIEVLVPAGLEGLVFKIVRADGESDADYCAAVSMYQGLFGSDFHIRDEQMTVLGTVSADALADLGFENPAESRADFLAVNSIETAIEDGDLTDYAAREYAVGVARGCVQVRQLAVGDVPEADASVRRGFHHRGGDEEARGAVAKNDKAAIQIAESEFGHTPRVSAEADSASVRPTGL